jgi:predicted metalloprotease with PDZ domain
VVISYFRRDQLREAHVVIGTSPERKLLLEPTENPSASAKAVQRGWLGPHS